MIKGKNLTNALNWVEDVSIVVYLKIKSPTKILYHKYPFEAPYGYKRTLSHLRIFGSKSFSHVPKEDRRKFYGKAIKCIFIDQKAYTMFDPYT